MSNKDQNWLQVTDDPTAIAAAIRRYEAAMRAASDAAVAAIWSDGFIDAQTRQLIEFQSARLEPELLATLPQLDERSARAAAWLCFFGRVEGRDAGIALLREGSLSAREAFLRCLVTRADAGNNVTAELSSPIRQMIGADLEFSRLLLAQLVIDDPELQDAAFAAFHRFPVPDAGPMLRDIGETTDLRLVGLVAWALSHLELDDATFQWMMARSRTRFEGSWVVGILLGEFALRGTEQQRTSVRAELLHLLSKTPLVSGSTRLEVLEPLCDSARIEDVDWLCAQAADPAETMRELPITAALQLDPNRGRALLLDLLRDGRTAPEAIEIAAVRFAGTIDDKLAAALRHAAGQVRGMDRKLALLRLAGLGIALDGGRAKRLPRDHGDIYALDEWLASRLVAHATIVQHAVSAGVLSAVIGEAAVAKIVDENKSVGPRPASMVMLLNYAGAAVDLDGEDEDCPPSHDRLLLEFAAGSLGAFRPDYVWQEDRSRQSVPSILRFASAGRLYEATLQDYGDRYDHARVAEAANCAVADGGRSERFLTWPTRRQCPWYAFAVPERLQDAARGLGFDLRLPPT